MLLPKVKTERLTIPEKELLTEITVLAPARRDVTSSKIPKKGVSRGGKNKSISPRSSATAKQRSVLGGSKYRPESRP